MSKFHKVGLAQIP